MHSIFPAPNPFQFQQDGSSPGKGNDGAGAATPSLCGEPIQASALPGEALPPRASFKGLQLGGPLDEGVVAAPESACHSLRPMHVWVENC